MAGYDPVAPFYDRIHGDRSQSIKYLKQLFKSYHPQAKSWLDLACGTGTLLKAMRRRYQTLAGLDIAADMLAVAKRKLPRVSFYHQDMTELVLDQQFDIISCLFASINHVLEFTDWQRLFARVKQHLAPGGIFVFDMLTELCLYNLVLNSPIITRHGSFISLGDISMAGEGQEGTVWQVKGFDVRKDSQELLFSSAVRQVSFDSERVEVALREHFDEVVIEDPEQGEVNERSELLYFICS